VDDPLITPPAVVQQIQRTRDQLESEAVRLFKKYERHSTALLETGRELGEVLTELRNRCNAGEWYPLLAKLEIPERTASRAIRNFGLAREGTGQLADTGQTPEENLEHYFSPDAEDGADDDDRDWERRQLAATVRDLHPDVRVGDFRVALADVPDNSVSLVFTDPPYDAESVPLYGDLARHAARILKDGGSCIVYAPSHALITVGNLMAEHLRYWWPLAIKHTGRNARMPGLWVFAEWKPLLWFVKGGRWNNEFVADLLPSEMPDKALHDWQQSEVEAGYVIERLTLPGELVVDPLCGSGTTLAAALKLGRRALGIEIDKERAKVATARLQRIEMPQANVNGEQIR
jgi:site-specific DNA-methyltransferase (adenine-specific)